MRLLALACVWVLLLTAANAIPKKGVNVCNAGQAAITSITAAPSVRPSWAYALLATSSPALNRGRCATFTIMDGTSYCSYNFLATSSNGRRNWIIGMNVCATHTPSWKVIN